ncbi:MAG: SURF1 family cytochrome oxidase biogenesis protein [Gammaproteobacteria bacterium]|nr:SURF1 family cytochrome oxidase biogenesis protein [Gammaproteobacteria bacterium]
MFTVLVFLAVVFLIFLGFWQIDRANEKKSIIEGLSSNPKKMSLVDLRDEALVGYEKIVLTGGYWLPEKFIKKNVVKDNQLGSQIYRLYCQEDICVIVNVGWVSMSQITTLKDESVNLTKLEGVVRVLPYVMIREKMPLSYFKGFGMIVSLDKSFLSLLTGKEIVDCEMLLDQSLTNYQQLTTIPKVSVARHYGYAIQFYLLALVLIIGYIYLKK